jgi:hypothetical protein
MELLYSAILFYIDTEHGKNKRSTGYEAKYLARLSI